MKRLAVFVSGRGSNFRKIHEGIEAGEIPGEETLVVSNNPDCPAADFAREHGIDVYHYPRSKDHPAEELLAALQDHTVDFVILAGYIKLVPAEVRIWIALLNHDRVVVSLRKADTDQVFSRLEAVLEGLASLPLEEAAKRQRRREELASR